MQRVMIIGQPGSGKSTLARKIGAAKALPVVHIDLIHWKAGWIERSGAEKDALIAVEHAKPKWVFEGGRSSTWPERLDRADTLIWIDLPLWLRMWRVLARTQRYRGISRPDLPEGCPEHYNWAFIKWIWDTRQRGRNQCKRLYEAAPATKDLFHLRNRGAVAAFVQELDHDPTAL